MDDITAPENVTAVENQQVIMDAHPQTGDRTASQEEVNQTNIDMLMDVTLQVAVELGQTRLTVREVLELRKGSVIELNRIAGDAVDVYVNDRIIARGEVVVVDDKFGVRLTEMIAPTKEDGDS